MEPALEADLSFFDENVGNFTEMETTARVVSIVKDAVLTSGDPQIRLHLQPSMDGQSSQTLLSSHNLTNMCQ